LRAVEARHPEAAAELEPVIRALSEPDVAVIDAEAARRLLGLGPATVARWLELGILPGRRDEATGEWIIPLAEVLRLRAEQEALTTAGGEDLTGEELAALSAARPGLLPWQRAAPDSR
jgi:hypothetical protein